MIIFIRCTDFRGVGGGRSGGLEGCVRAQLNERTAAAGQIRPSARRKSKVRSARRTCRRRAGSVRWWGGVCVAGEGRSGRPRLLINARPRRNSVRRGAERRVETKT